MADQTSGDLEQALEYFKRFGAEARGLGDALNYAEKAAEELKEEFTSGTRDVSRLKSSLESSARAVKDSEKKYAKAQEEYNNTTDASRKEELRQSLAATRQRREELAEQHSILDREITARIDVIEAQKAMAESAVAAAKALKTSIGGVLGGLQGNASAVGIAGSALAGGISVLGATSSAAGSALSAVGGAATALPGNFKYVGIGLDLLGKSISIFSKGISEVAGAAIPYLVKEIERTLTSFQTISTSGALFADGMTGMRQTAAESGLSLETFSKVVSSNSATLAATGMSVAGATARFASINKIIGTNGLQQQMLNLGYSLEEIGGLTADVMADLNRGGSLRYASDGQIAQLTAQYSKDLRVLSAITGEDARKKLEEGRKLTTQIAVRTKLMELEKQQPGVTANFIRLMGALPADMQQSFMEKFTTGAIFNKAGAQASAVSSAYQDTIVSLVTDLESGSSSISNMVRILGDTGDRFNAEISSGKFFSVGVAGLAGSVGEVNQALSGFAGLAERLSKEGVEKVLGVTEDQAKTTDDLTKKVTQLPAQMEAMRQEMEKLVMDSGALKTFGNVLGLVTDAMRDAITKLGSEVKEGMLSRIMSTGAKRAEQGATIGGSIGSVGGAVAGGVLAGGVSAGTAAIGGAALGGMGGGILGSTIGGIVGGIEGVIEGALGSGKALGGISAGPESGYLEKLHGVEAVVPLPDGRSIPVSMDSQGFEDLARLMREQIKLIQDMANTLRDSQDIQDRLLANSY